MFRIRSIILDNVSKDPDPYRTVFDLDPDYEMAEQWKFYECYERKRKRKYLYSFHNMEKKYLDDFLDLLHAKSRIYNSLLGI